MVILAALAASPYLSSLRNGFVYDDFDQVLTNPYIRSFHHLREIFTSSVWSFMGDFRGATNYYRPMMSVGYLICYRAFGLDPQAFHLVSLLANVGVVLLVFLVTLRMFHSSHAAIAAAFIFALHPIHSEAVDWIAAVTELELAFFYLAAFGLFLASAREAGQVSTALQIASAGTFVLALLSKEQAITLPLVATLYEHFYREDRAESTTIQKVRRYAAFWGLAAVYIMVRINYLRGFAPSLGRPGFGKEDTVISALALLGHYCWKLIWPVALCGYYVFPIDVAALIPWAVAGLVALGLGAWGFVALQRASRPAAFGVLWFFLTLAPVLNVRWMTSNPFAERYLYLASVGFCWVTGWAAMASWNALSRRGYGWRVTMPIAGLTLAALCWVRITIRNRDWRDNVAFYTATLASSPDSYYMHNNLGTVYWGQGNIRAASTEWQVALRLAPESEYVLHNLGLVANEQKDYRQAESYFLHALAVRPDYSDAHLDLGKSYEAMGRWQEAEQQLRAAENLSPLKVRAHIALSEFYFDRHRLVEAEAEARRSVEIQPTTQGDWDLGLAEWRQGNFAGAEHALLDAKFLNPSDSRAHFMLGLLYKSENRSEDAIREYRAGLQLDPGNRDAVASLEKLQSPRSSRH
jgi:tetratricopeptide (TPR) repeat protein